MEDFDLVETWLVDWNGKEVSFCSVVDSNYPTPYSHLEKSQTKTKTKPESNSLTDART